MKRKYEVGQTWESDKWVRTITSITKWDISFNEGGESKTFSDSSFGNGVRVNKAILV